MRRSVIALTAAMMLAGCSAREAEKQDTSVPDTTAVTTTETVTETTTITATVQVTEAATESSTINEEYESDLYTRHIEKVPTEEQAALDKLRAKYGKDFIFVYREVQWEFIDKPIPEKRPTTYALEDDDGRRFYAYGTEDSDEISGDNYAFPLFEDELLDHAKDYIRSYTQAGKLWLPTPTMKTMPFEAPAELTYEEFFSYFCKQEGKVHANIFLPEGTELPTELSVFDNMNYLYLDGFGCKIVIYVYYLPQRDYDRLEDVMYGDIYINRDHMREAN